MKKTDKKIKLLDKQWWTMYFVLLVVLLCYAVTLSRFDEINNENKIFSNYPLHETFDMCSTKTLDYFGLAGIYFSDNYYCVWTKDEIPSSIQSTEYHEACHYFKDLDRGHFCNKNRQNNTDIRDWENHTNVWLEEVNKKI